MELREIWWMKRLCSFHPKGFNRKGVSHITKKFRNRANMAHITNAPTRWRKEPSSPEKEEDTPIKEVTHEVLRQMKQGKRKTMTQEANKTLVEIQRLKRQKRQVKIQLREKAQMNEVESEESSSDEENQEDTTKMQLEEEVKNSWKSKTVG